MLVGFSKGNSNYYNFFFKATSNKSNLISKEELFQRNLCLCGFQQRTSRRVTHSPECFLQTNSDFMCFYFFKRNPSQTNLLSEATLLSDDDVHRQICMILYFQRKSTHTKVELAILLLSVA